MVTNDSGKAVVILVEWFLSGIPNKRLAVETSIITEVCCNTFLVDVMLDYVEYLRTFQHRGT